MDRNEINKKGVQNGLKWIFGSADSPWQQGAVESLVKAAKRAIFFAVGKQRLTVPDKNVWRGEYRLAVVKEVFPDRDGKVRRVLVTYKNFHVGENTQCYGQSKAVTISRSVQRLALIVLKED